MREFLNNSVFFAVFLALLGFMIGLILKKKLKLAIFNPLLVSVVFVIAVILAAGLDHESFSSNSRYLSWFLTPATVCLAIPLYKQLKALRENWLAILGGITAGVLSSFLGIFAIALIFGLTNSEYVTLLPKSITAAIGTGISEELGGIVSITLSVTVLTGIFGNIFAEVLCKLFRIKDPVAKGLAIGTASHAIGTAKALEMGETEGAMSSLAIAVSGLISVILASFFAQLI